jgi:hypothetical protein
MKKLVLFSAVVLMAAASTASALTVSLTPDPIGPLNLSDTFSVTVSLDTQGSTIISAQMRLIASLPGILQANSIAYNGAVWDALTGPSNGGLNFLPVPHGLNPQSNPFGSVPNSFFWSGNDALATIQLEVIGIPEAGSVDLTVGGGDSGVFADDFVTDLLPGATKDGTTINIVPEPVSMLLLLAGLPLLRRRR